jgi:glutamyl-tRNA synthetase
MAGASSTLTGAPESYRGRLAPSPTGYLHLGHARTFWRAQERARAAGGTLILRLDDLDRERCRPEFVAALFEDLRWFGFEWQEGPDVPGAHDPRYFQQSARAEAYRAAFQTLQQRGHIYPCHCSRKDIRAAANAPHAADDEPIYPGTCRPLPGGPARGDATGHTCWRFQVPDGEGIEFVDVACGPQRFVAGRDFGDFVVRRADGTFSYQLACVVDDAAMGITEVVRGRDLLLSTARQMLLYRAMGWQSPAFHHCPLMTDDQGVRLAKRHAALSLREQRARGFTPEQLRAAPDWNR